jgi:hypothetical protein
MNTFEIQSWPTRDLRISTHKVCSTTGKVLRIRETKHFRKKSWWKKFGFSFNGKINVKCT